MSTPSRSTSSDETYDSGLDIHEDDELTFYDGSTEDEGSGSRSELEIRAVDDFAESEADGTSSGSHGLVGEIRSTRPVLRIGSHGLIGKIRSISPILRVIMGLGIMFILPWIWMIIFGLFMVHSMTNYMTNSYSAYNYNPQGMMGFVMVLYTIDYGGAAIFFIIGIVMTISGIMDWWRAKQNI